MKLFQAAPLLMLAGSVGLAQHGHLNVGAVGTNQNDQLNFNNGSDFIASSGYVKTLDFTNSGKYANYFSGNISLTVLHSTNAFGEPVAGSPAPGSLIEVQLIRLSGPPGGKFGFWDDAVSTTSPVFEVPSGTLNGTNRYLLSNTAAGAGQPGADPFGHIHGRRFSADKAGVYKVGFKAHDISTNGAGGGPIHAPSDILDVFFQAGYHLTTLTRTGTTAYVTVGTATNFQFTLQANTNVTQPNGWTNITTVNGTDFFETFIDPDANTPARFYRVNVVPVPP